MSETGTDTTTTDPKNGKPPRKPRSMGTLCLAFVTEVELSDGQKADGHIVPRGQPAFASVKEVKDFVGTCIGAGDFEEEFNAYKVQVVRLVGDAMSVEAKVTTKVTFSA